MTFTIPTPLCAELIIPFYQPIIGADQQSIVGYEILGRYQVASTIYSLGSYFQNDKVNLDSKKYADRCVRTKSLEMIEHASLSNKSYFFNINPSFFTEDEDTLFYEQVVKVLQTKNDLKPHHFVLEITEANFSDHNSLFLQRLTKYRELGCKIAVDDLGKGFSNLERVASLRPNILKIDLSIVQKSVTSQSHRDVLHALSILSQRIGAELLLEGIETIELLKNAWWHGAQYYQGYYFSEPKAMPIEEMDCLHLFHHQLESMIEGKIAHLHDKSILEENLNILMKKNIVNISHTKKNYDGFIESIYSLLPSSCFRIYICNRLGYQLSGNHVNHDQSNWKINHRFRNKNWSWRPYFLQNIINMEVNQRGFLSDLYTDIETRDIVHTFSFPIQKNTYLFIDLAL
ncbi:EAL domain-containing protein [Halalkalibacter okhensis]|uniref:EAL domain-containing protein n=1 Tax=Halalkalibacter okhensis TaxID=333138 RepID=A0A0B0IL45_9BACI|nr:EAL-associated domain-containing protein [Halalkalibacter okhensis]KHF42030.1 hypothetical protein LQ50_01725 [Halalkalibacter okhensis]